MMRNILILLLLTGSFSSIDLLAQTNPAQPNILLIIADDVGVDASQGYQNSALLPTTPTLDSLRANGLTFDNAWATPVCTPTRASLMSGHFGVKTGVTAAPGKLDTAFHSLFRELADQTNDAYAGAVIGKWHIDNANATTYTHPMEHGVDYYEGMYQSGVTDYYNWDKVSNGVVTPETTYATTYLTDQAISWVNAQNSPWFLWLAEVAPHSPYHVPPTGLYTIGNVNTNRQKYMAAIEALDAEIARLLANIPAAVRANTVVIYIGDNGTPGNVIQNYPGTHAKGTLYQGGIHVPFMVTGPAVTRINEREGGLVHTNDLYATILEIAGASLPGGIYNSLSLEPLLTNPNANSRPYNYSDLESAVDGWTIRNDRYKLISFTDSTQEFFDLLLDTLEANDLINTLSSAELAVKQDLETEALTIRSGWSCRDLIQNGDETGIDCGGSSCTPCITAIEDGIESKLKCYPNPSQGQFFIQTEEVTIESIRVFSASGKLVYSQDGMRSKAVSIDLGEFPAQLFFLEVKGKDWAVYKKLMKQ